MGVHHAIVCLDPGDAAVLRRHTDDGIGGGALRPPFWGVTVHAVKAQIILIFPQASGNPLLHRVAGRVHRKELKITVQPLAIDKAGGYRVFKVDGLKLDAGQLLAIAIEGPPGLHTAAARKELRAAAQGVGAGQHPAL